MITALTRYVEICGVIGKYVNQHYRIAEEPLINVPPGHTCIYILYHTMEYWMYDYREATSSLISMGLKYLSVYI